MTEQAADLPPDLAAAGWRWETGALARSFRFRDFAAAFAFMTRVAALAEAASHHPDWRNVWNRVEIRLFTHSAGRVTEKDIRLAREIEALDPPAARAVV